MSDEGIRHVFSTSERDAFKQSFEAEEQWKEDVRFLDQVFFTAASAQPAPLAFSNTVQWNAWFATARAEAIKRKRQVQSLRLSRLTSVVDMFTRKEESDSLSQYFPLNHYRILREREAAAAAAKNSQSRSPDASPTRNDSPAAAAASDDDNNDAATKKKPVGKDGGGAKKTKHVTAAQQDIQRVIESLPPYLRKHYEEEGALEGQ
jgi:hypothetical protein